MRTIHPGMQTKTEVEVLHGIDEGERIVISSAYVINSAYIYGNGANTIAGMKI